LEKPAGKAGGEEKWDQFAANKQLFGLKTDYDENIYTTEIDTNHPEYQKRVANAKKIEKEILSKAAATAHVAEERVMDFVGGADQRDEEEKYATRPTPHPLDNCANWWLDIAEFGARTSQPLPVEKTNTPPLPDGLRPASPTSRASLLILPSSPRS
jgi:hypothetical protein